MPVVRGKNIEPLFTAEQIRQRNLELAQDIIKGPCDDLLVISVLKGSFIFAADLIRALHDVGLAPEVEFITLSSYGTGTVSQGVKIIKDIDSDVKGRNILLIDDILESGRTLTALLNDVLDLSKVDEVRGKIPSLKHARPFRAVDA